MIRPLAPFDVSKLKVQEKQVWYKSHIDKMAIAGSLNDAFTYTENNQVKAVVGMQPFWAGRSVVWALIGNVDSWIIFHREAKTLMESHAVKRGIIRLEMTTEIGFDESERWARMLGFKEESLMKRFGMDGKDHKMWVKLWQQQSQ